jgi:hypothetical protein
LAILGLCFEDSLFFVLAALPPASNDTTTSWNMLHLEDFWTDSQLYPASKRQSVPLIYQSEHVREKPAEA